MVTHRKTSSASRNGHATSTRKSSRKRTSEDGEGNKTHDIWRGVISFGLVEIPVALVSTEKPGGISLSMLDKRDFSPIGYRRYNKSNDEEVKWADIVHGYEYEKGKYVVVGKKELAKADPELAEAITIDEFVEFSEIPAIQFDRTYYIEPLHARSKGYALLRGALERAKKVGVARLVLRTRQYVALVAVHGPSLVLHLLRYDAEIRKPGALENLGSTVRVTEAEAKMADKLVADMTGTWRPTDYHDDYTKSLLSVIERKVKSGDVHAIEREAPESKGGPRETVDIMSLLKRSLAKRGSPAASSNGTVRPRARVATARRRSTRRPSRARRT